MKSKVYFISVSDRDKQDAVKAKFAKLLDDSNILDFIEADNKAAIKIHFGEEENTGFVKPEYVRLVCDRIVKKNASPILTDTNTLYCGKRVFSASHLELAHQHGFTEDIVGAPVIIAGDFDKDLDADVHINQKFTKVAKIAPLFKRMDAIIGVAHFKGHLMTGFGGALKNLGMGCAAREGKLYQHCGIAPFVRLNACVGCSQCKAVCPAEAIFIENKKAQIKISECIGCASCISACKHHAIDIHWEKGAGNMQEKMVEYTKAALMGKEKKKAFINFAIKITKECDCLAKDDPKIMPDVGIFASQDPVSIDKASVDMVNKLSGRDIFREIHPARDWQRQLDYAGEIGIGSLDYELIKL